MNIIWKGSPNSDSNRKSIDRIVSHWFGIGTLTSANNGFQTANNSSAHYGISGNKVWQWVKEEHVAYHAGNYKMNQRSIGIEHDATAQKDRNPHGASDDTYKTSAALIAQICEKYDIPLDRTHIIGHKEVPRATQCPGTIDINRLIDMAKGIVDEMPNYVDSLLREDLGLDVKKTEGEFRGRVAELKRSNEKYNEQEKRIKSLEKDVSGFAAEAAEYEERLRISEESRNRFEKEIGEIKDMVSSRDTEIGKLQEQVDTLEKNMDPETSVIIPKEDYERLTKRKTLDRHTTPELVRTVLGRYKDKIINSIISIFNPERG